MLNYSNQKSTGVSFFSLLGLLFIGLKLGGIIDWSWWWVLAPIWGPAAIAVIIIFIVLMLRN